MKKYPFSYYRGGTSRGLFFHKKDLPAERALWDKLFLKVLGIPEHGERFSVMGTDFPTKKIAVISRSELSSADVEYDFFQVDPENATVEHRGSCGNMASAVGLFAMDEGLIDAIEPESVVRIYNSNTKRMIVTTIKIKNGMPLVNGDVIIRGVPEAGTPVELNFESPGGGYSGKLFPTGRKIDVLDLPKYGKMQATIIDCVNPIVILKAADLGLSGQEIGEFGNLPETSDRIETARCVTAQILGLVTSWEDAKQASTYIPHTVLVSPPRSYKIFDGSVINDSDMDICCRAIFTKLHKTFPVGAAVGVAAATAIKGTLAAECLIKKEAPSEIVNIGHPAGVLRVDIEVEKDEVLRGTMVRSARRLLSGIFCVVED